MLWLDVRVRGHGYGVIAITLARLGCCFLFFRFFFCDNTPFKIVNDLVYKKYGNNKLKVMFYHQSDFDSGQALDH